MFIYEIPNDIKRQLIRTLDYNDDWKELGGIHMGYKVFDIQEIESESRRTQSSPTNHLLNRWSQQNHKVVELFILLARMEHVPAMQCLKSVVPKEYHRLIDLSQIKSQSNPMSGVHDSNNNAPNATRPAGHSVPSGIVSRDSNWVPILIAEIEKGNKIQASSKILNIQSDTSCTNDSMPRSVSDGLVDSASAIPMISYHELVEATNNWHPSNILGKGGFGVVYKGDWKHTAVAIKQLRLSVALEGESLRELKFLNSCRHDNVLPLYGYSVGGKEPCLVYQLMTGGSLEQRLKCKDGRPPLTWKQRLSISRGIACGLQYLHNAPNAPLIHGDIKTANILLDTCGEPRIGDFGLARRGPHGDDMTHLKVSRVHGTLPYLPDELIRGRRLSPAVDTFSFGVVLFEIATALPPVDPERGADKFLKDFIPNVCFNGNDVAILEDPRLIGTIESNSELCRKLIQLGMECSKPKPAERPGMVQVWQNLMNF